MSQGSGEPERPGERGSTAHQVSEDSGQLWTEPGAWPVAPGVRRIPLPLPMDGLRAVNVYVIETDDGLVLVDGGWAIPESRDRFEWAMKQADYRLADIRRFLVTHLHRDHYTQARVLGDELGVPVTLGSGDRASMELINEKHADEMMLEDTNISRLRAAGAEHLAELWRQLTPANETALETFAMPDEWLEADVELELGSRRIDAVSTPGHTQGHYVFAEQEAGLLFAGDHVLPTITPSIGFEPMWVDQPLRDFYASLAKVRALPDLRLLPAHGPIAPSSHTRVEELVAHHDDRLELCQKAVAGGARTAWEVAGELPWTRRERTVAQLGGFDKAMAAFETLAHLELLSLQGRLRRATEGDVRTFHSVG